MKTNALVVLWKGEQLPDYLVRKIAEILITNGICTPEMLTIKVLDETAITNAAIQSANCTVTGQFTKVDDNVAEAVKQSIIYIGKRFEDSLKGANGPIGNIATFAIELSNAVITAKRNMSFIGVGTRDELLTAIEVLSTTSAVIPSSFAKKYGITQNVIEVIKKVYKSY
jgi:hypothetical protein